jgi:hypothetical protein
MNAARAIVVIRYRTDYLRSRINQLPPNAKSIGYLKRELSALTTAIASLCLDRNTKHLKDQPDWREGLTVEHGGTLESDDVDANAT